MTTLKRTQTIALRTGCRREATFLVPESRAFRGPGIKSGGGKKLRVERVAKSLGIPTGQAWRKIPSTWISLSGRCPWRSGKFTPSDVRDKKNRWNQKLKSNV